MTETGEDSDDVMTPAFNIEAEVEDYDLDMPPTSGQEYLRRVQLEAKQVPAVVVAEIDSSLLTKKQTVGIRNTNSILPSPAGFAPPLAWQNKQSADFAEVRQNLVRFKTKVKREKLKPKLRLPLKEDVEKWCKFCFGKYQGGSQNAAAQNMSTTGSDKSGTPPLLSIVCHMDQTTVVSVLEYHVNWFEATGFTPEQGRWFYALLANLEKPLVPEACSLLRNLARNCANLRATLDSADDPVLVHLNLLITLVARYFNQRDLADDG